jgi:hypothetical protein
MTPNRFLEVTKLVLVTFVALVSTTCSISSDKQLITPSCVTNNHSTIVSSISEVVTSTTPTMIFTSSATPPVTNKPTPTLTQAPEFNILQVPVLDPNNLETEIYLETVFWSDNGEIIYYALSSPINGSYERTLQWLAYEIRTGMSITLTTTPKIDRNIVLPLHYPEFYPEVRGITSPSRRYTFREIPNESNQTTEIWLSDLVTQKETKLVETFPCYVNSAEWFSDETQVIFDIAYQEYGGISYLTNIQTGITETLCKPDDLQCWIIEERVTLSPDDSMLAGLASMDGQFQIRIDTLNDGTSTYIKEDASQPTWSFDGRLLYYWLGIPWAGTPITQLRVYDTTSCISSTVVEMIDLIERGVCPSEFDCYFDVSPSGKQFVFWNRIDKSFWIVIFS